MTLFLQYRSKVKKFVLPEGYDDLSIGRLQLAFIEKFSWNTQLNGADLPDIYIQDPVSGVRHELEELSDIKDRTVLVLNVEPLDEVKKHIDEVSARSRRWSRRSSKPWTTKAPPSSECRTATGDGQRPRPPGRGAPDPSRRLPGRARTRVCASSTRRKSARSTTPPPGPGGAPANVLNFQAEVQGSMAALRTKATNVKMAAAKVAVPGLDGGDAGHSYVATGRKQLQHGQRPARRPQVDDLQDLVEDLRKDVVIRGVRPLPRQLEHVTKDITQLTNELKRMEEYMKREKPIWTKIWEKELEDVCQGRDELRLMEDLMVDLRDDLEKASESVCPRRAGHQRADEGHWDRRRRPDGPRSPARELNNITNNAGVDPNAAKEGVLGEVRALQPNHQDRLEAIERAEKLRQKELGEPAGNPMQEGAVRVCRGGQAEEVGRLRGGGAGEEGQGRSDTAGGLGAAEWNR